MPPQGTPSDTHVYCEVCSLPGLFIGSHPHILRLGSGDPGEEIDMVKSEFTLRTITDSFDLLVPGSMDLPIKRDALARWESILPELQSGPKDRVDEFDLQPAWEVLGDVLFPGFFRVWCRLKWEDREELNGYDGKITDLATKGQICWIWVARPSIHRPQTVPEALSILLQQMCDAMISLTCGGCKIYIRKMDMINGRSLTDHGPVWQVVKHVLSGLSQPFELCHSTEPDTPIEEAIKFRMLRGLSNGAERLSNVSKRLKVQQRARRDLEKEPNTPEEGYRDQVLGDALEYIVAMLE